MKNTFPEDMMGDVMEVLRPFRKRETCKQPRQEDCGGAPTHTLAFLHAQQQATGAMPGAGTVWQGKAISPAGGLRPTAHRHSQETDADVHDGIVGRSGGAGYFEDGAFNWKKGERVRVIDGRFKGLEGEIRAHQWRPSPHRVDRRGLCCRHHLYTKMFSRKNIKSYEIS